MYRYRVEYLKEEQTRNLLVSEHEELVKAIREGDVQKAQDISFHHLENQRKAIIRTIRAENEAKEAEKKNKNRICGNIKRCHWGISFLTECGCFYPSDCIKDGDFMETRKISISLHENESYIRKRCENCDDILIRPMRLGEGHKADCLMVYIEVAVSNMMLDDSAIGKMINHFWEIPEEKIREFIRRNSLGIADVKELSSMEEVFGAILSGNAVFFLDGYDKAMKISSKGYPGLAVSEVKTEKVLRGSKEGFCDSVKPMRPL